MQSFKVNQWIAGDFIFMWVKSVKLAGWEGIPLQVELNKNEKTRKQDFPERNKRPFGAFSENSPKFGNLIVPKVMGIAYDSGSHVTHIHWIEAH